MITLYRPQKSAIKTASERINTLGWTKAAECNPSDSYSQLFIMLKTTFCVEPLIKDVTQLVDTCIINGSIQKVALVETNNLEAAFELSQSINCAWTENKEVTLLPNSGECFLSSTSVGDILEDEHGKRHIVSDIGFLLLA